MDPISTIDSLLGDKLFQVIGSTPRSIADSLLKIDLRNKPKEGAQIFALSIFAAAVNKSTLESFMADSRFAEVRPLISSAISIQGRTNMTAIVLLGHCILTTRDASSVRFSSEFKKKMGQNHLWDGTFDKGSLSEKQKTILREKQRLIDENEAKALGSGFLKYTGLSKGDFTPLEAELFKEVAQNPSSRQRMTQAFGAAPGLSPQSRERRVTPPGIGDNMTSFMTSETHTVQVPQDVLDYRRNILKQSDVDISESINRNGRDKFISNTRTLMSTDPDGSRTLGASKIGR